MELKDANLSGMEDHMFRPRETKGLCTPHIHSLLSPSKKKKSKQQLTKKITVVGKLRKKKEKKEFNQSIN